MKIGYLILSSVLILGFQNCSKSGFGLENPSIQRNIACADQNTCVSSDSNTSSTSPTPTPTPDSMTSTATNTNSAVSLYNIVSGTGQADCEKAIADRYGKQISCSLGGGCGISCGKPGGSCVSANPSYYGACFTPEELKNAPAAQVASTPTKTMTYYNFVAGDKTTCEKSVSDRLGLQVSCKIGGGCGLSCGIPSATCLSANPTAWGACLYQ